jgi:hypothetical protein
MKNTKYTEAHLEAYRQHLIADYNKWSPGSTCAFSVEFEPGQKYTRVVTVQTSSRSAHSFIDADGKIWKSASWKAPAKNFTRGDVTTGDFLKIRWCGV